MSGLVDIWTNEMSKLREKEKEKCQIHSAISTNFTQHKFILIQPQLLCWEIRPTLWGFPALKSLKIGIFEVTSLSNIDVLRVARLLGRTQLI
ncbi:hypothetical protein MTR_4g068570 [Medicago truncatula]|uniref:Uncharacterized protein n=1 Tax=Medicago truncatula TaxID=3880 RepID=G7JF01_MEDTR|nr:hypothetical protein MTR_4g068570 [Medicago truncatula]